VDIPYSTTGTGTTDASFRSLLYEQDASVEPLDLPIWREALAPLEWMALHFSPVFYGCGIARGDSEPVVIVPGFLGNDAYLTTLYWWLARMGYRPFFSRIGHNADCPDHLAGALHGTVQHARAETGQRVHIIGHSLGGMLARSVALDHPDDVASVITLGSPFRDSVRAHPAVLDAAEMLRRTGGVGNNIGPTCFSGHCVCPFTKNMLQPGVFEPARFAVYSKNDAVVDWASCIEEDPSLNYEVTCTHIGMAFDAKTYAVIGEVLARARNHERIVQEQAAVQQAAY
jgi:pimeloyl-ACP methyl ester carboxylesterase